jgi:quinol monooxygenase YgiN
MGALPAPPTQPERRANRPASPWKTAAKLSARPSRCSIEGGRKRTAPYLARFILVRGVELPSRSYSKQEKTMTRYALYVPLQAKPGKEKDVADFLRSAVPLVNDEPGTISWFAIQEGPSSFAIFDTFDDEAGRDAHLNGKVAAALMEKAKAGDLFAKTPEIMKLEILADKLPK